MPGPFPPAASRPCSSARNRRASASPPPCPTGEAGRTAPPDGGGRRSGTPSWFSSGSGTDAAVLDRLLDLLLAHPRDHVVVHVDEAQVHLVVLHLVVAGRIDDRVD